ncbi:MAG TPA: endolytic transglycosylase MltG [Nocardioides sp.]|nr:endolytic transglycosylase MltG [Nocardioides sp.]
MTDEHDTEYDGVLGGAATETYDEVPPGTGGRRRGRKRRSVPGCLAVLVALAVIVGGFYFVVTWGIEKVGDQFSSAADYDGPGHGKVTFQVVSGDSAAAIGRRLKEQGVVASVDAFIDAANSNPDWSNLQAGYFPLRKEMPAEDAVAVLVDPGNMVKSTVTVPEGLRVVDIVAILAKNTDYPAKAFEKVLAKPGQLGLPDYANGNPEGYLFPATYDFGPDATPKSMLTAMVNRWQQAAEDADLEAKADELGYTPAELMTVASLVQSEGRGDDMPKIARVIYNRLEGDETNGLLQIDSTVNYAAGNKLGAVPTSSDLELDSPYNTYRNTGLPPTPIEAPGDDAIEAATHPADGDWYYYVTVNLKTGETKFAETYDEFLQYKQELQDYCENESGGAC